MILKEFLTNQAYVQKKCPDCASLLTKKNGHFRGKQRYLCTSCGIQFVHNTKPSPETLWYEHTEHHQTVDALSERFHLSEKTVRTYLDAFELPPWVPVPRTMVAVADATMIGDSWILVIRDPHAHENVYSKEIVTEATSDYQEGFRYLEEQQFIITAVVGDGRIMIPWLFPKVLMQMCHFHQEQIVVRYLTRKPELPASKELLDLIHTLSTNDEASFTDAFSLWCRTWKDFLNEKTTSESGRVSYTHKRVRSARDSIKRHLPYLFTFERYPELKIPNTTNSLDGNFKKVKMAIGIHSGQKHKRKVKMVLSMLRKKLENPE